MNKIYETLYSKDSVGNIRIWYMEQQDNRYRTVSGIKEGQLVTSEFTECQGKNEGKKNETSGITQATAEINARYKKQLKSSGYWKNVDDIDKISFIEPILAKKYKDYADKIDFTKEVWGMQNKYNGICCIASSRGFYSRKNERFVTIPHIEESLESFFEAYPTAVAHGELFNYDYRQQLNEIVKLCRKTTNITQHDLDQSKKLIKFYIYDGYNEDVGLGESLPYSKRKDWIDTNVIKKFTYCEEVKTEIIKSKEDLNRFFQERMENGDEGAILRKMDMPYEHKRSKNLLKMKSMDQEEFIITAISPGIGNWAGKAKIISLKSLDSSIVFNATFKGSMNDAITCLNEKDKWIGQVVSIDFNGRTAFNIPQYAQFNYQNCLVMDK